MRSSTSPRVGSPEQAFAFQRLIQENVRDFAIFAIDTKRRATSWNAGAERLFGYSEAEVLGQSVDILFTSEDRAHGVPQQEVATAAEEGCAGDERWHLRKNGERVFVSGAVRPVLDEDGHISGFVKVGRDITERVRREELLRQQAAAMEASMDGMAILNAHEKYTYLNAAHARVYGYDSPAELIGKSWEVLYNESELKRFRTEIMPVLRREGQWRGEAVGKCRDGRLFPQELSLSRIDAGGLVCVVRDVTDRKRFQERLEETVAERTRELQTSVAELESFSYSMSHDLRAPLRAIIGFSQILAHEAIRLGPPATDYADKIIRAAQRMDHLIQDVLIYSRIIRQSMHLEPVDVEALIGQIIAENPGFQSPAVRIEIRTPLALLLGHEASLIQCIYNLIGNAVKFVAPGVVPQIHIWTEATPAGKVRLFFQDNGIGIDPVHHRQIFGMFQRLHRDEEYPGTGIGLAIVQKAVDRMGGTVGVESQPGKGSRFWIELSAAVP